jgi:glycine/D-amino acid oxidase-like deaminating enzyme
MIVGAGLTGACSALALVRAGHEVTVVDAGEPGRATTSNSGSAVLYQTKDSELFVEMTRRSGVLWDALAAAGACPFRRHGSHVLFSGPEEEEFVARRAAFLGERGVKVERLDRAALDGLMPALHPGIEGSYFCAEDGEANPFESCTGILAAAVRAGARLMAQAGQAEIETTGRMVRTEKAGAIDGDAVLIAAGPRTAAMAAACGTELPVFPERGEQLQTFPMPPTLRGRLLSARYTRGKAAGAFVGLALGQEPDMRIKIGSTREPGQSELVTSERARTALLEELALCFPELAKLPIERHTVGVRVGSRTGRPIVAELPSSPGVFVIDGLGGNGVAFAPLLGELVAGLVAGRPDPLLERLCRRADHPAASDMNRQSDPT